MNKKYLIIGIVAILVIVGGVIFSSETTQAESDALVGTQWSGTIEGNAVHNYSSSFYDYIVTWEEMGEFTFTITKPKYVLKINGTGSGKTTAVWTGDCTAEGSLTTGLIIEGRVNEITGNLEFGIRDDFAGREAHAFVERECRSPKWTGVRPSNDSFSASFDSIPPFSLEPVSGASAEGSINFLGEEGAMKYKITISKGSSAQDVDIDSLSPAPISKPEPEPTITPKVVPEPEAVSETQDSTKPEPEEAEDPAFDPSIAFTMTRVQGEVEYQQDDRSWRTVAAGDHIPPGVPIRTKDGIATIQFTDGSSLDIGRNTRFKVDIPEKSFLETLVELNAGQIKVKVQNILEKPFQRRAPMRIRTTRAVATVRGTEFVVEHDSELDISTIYLFEGSLEITPNEGEAEIFNAGQIITFYENGTNVVLPLSQQEWNELIDAEFNFEEKAAGRKLLVIPFIIVFLGALYWFLRRRRLVLRSSTS